MHGNTSLRFEKNVVNIQLAVKSREMLEQLCVHKLLLRPKGSSVFGTGKLFMNVLSNSACKWSKVFKYSRFILSAEIAVRLLDSKNFFPSVKFVTNCFRWLMIFWVLLGRPFWPTEEDPVVG